MTRTYILYIAALVLIVLFLVAAGQFDSPEVRNRISSKMLGENPGWFPREKFSLFPKSAGICALLASLTLSFWVYRRGKQKGSTSDTGSRWSFRTNLVLLFLFLQFLIGGSFLINELRFYLFKISGLPPRSDSEILDFAYPDDFCHSESIANRTEEEARICMIQIPVLNGTDFDREHTFLHYFLYPRKIFVFPHFDLFDPTRDPVSFSEFPSWMQTNRIDWLLRYHPHEEIPFELSRWKGAQR